ncbi:MULTISPECIES: hypothetical protein [unclassified Chelatococcus]|uniref:hypothetical protein n=1 Tax=unclassified Chelatococcus TaxID=2638111 RepID=UPI001BCE9772|nr:MULTISPECIES: hypothetical protein [unclassified Chelatococcus]MBS7743276.1 hypothetical protein [Chelatococcus sp. HY11]MBX3541606.1 hypothetical protein [Chelatococcus sp.]MCO5074502.1 hypothetical protein [Chelatococcus sp.]
MASRLLRGFVATFVTAMPMRVFMPVPVVMPIMRSCHRWLTMMLFITAVIVSVMLLSHLLEAFTLWMMVILARRCRHA